MKELKELLKPPFGIIENDTDGAVIVDKAGHLLGIDKYYSRMNFDQWKDFTNWLKAALNEKAEREWGEPLRWIRETDCFGDDYCSCPKCEKSFDISGGDEKDNNYNYCPNCGQKLDPPEESDG